MTYHGNDLGLESLTEYRTRQKMDNMAGHSKKRDEYEPTADEKSDIDPKKKGAVTMDFWRTMLVCLLVKCSTKCTMFA